MDKFKGNGKARGCGLFAVDRRSVIIVKWKGLVPVRELADQGK